MDEAAPHQAHPPCRLPCFHDLPSSRLSRLCYFLRILCLVASGTALLNGEFAVLLSSGSITCCTWLSAWRPVCRELFPYVQRKGMAGRPLRRSCLARSAPSSRRRQSGRSARPGATMRTWLRMRPPSRSGSHCLKMHAHAHRCPPQQTAASWSCEENITYKCKMLGMTGTCLALRIAFAQRSCSAG